MMFSTSINDHRRIDFFEMEGVPLASASKGCTLLFLLDYSPRPYKNSIKINLKPPSPTRGIHTRKLLFLEYSSL
jgi:hypothetical protein